MEDWNFWEMPSWDEYFSGISNWDWSMPSWDEYFSGISNWDIPNWGDWNQAYPEFPLALDEFMSPFYGIKTGSSGLSGLLSGLGKIFSSPVTKALLPLLGAGMVGYGRSLLEKGKERPSYLHTGTVSTAAPMLQITTQRSSGPSTTTTTESSSKWESQKINFLFPEEDLRKFVRQLLTNSEEAIKKAKNIPHLSEAEKKIVDRVVNMILSGDTPEQLAASQVLRQLFYTGKLPDEWKEAERLLKQGVDEKAIRSQIESVLGPMLGTHGRVTSVAGKAISDILEQNRRALAQYYLQRAQAQQQLEQQALEARARAAQLYPQLALGPTSFARYIAPAAYEKAALSDWLRNFVATNNLLREAINQALTRTGYTISGGTAGTATRTVTEPTRTTEVFKYPFGPEITQFLHQPISGGVVSPLGNILASLGLGLAGSFGEIWDWLKNKQDK